MPVYSARLKDIMTNTLNTARTTAEIYGLSKDYLADSTIATCKNLAKARIAQGII